MVQVLGEVQKTERGFEVIKFNDLYHEECTLQQSSLAEYETPGSSAVWLGCEHNAKVHLGNEMSPRMHLDRRQVKCLITHLQQWLDTNTFKLEEPQP